MDDLSRRTRALSADRSVIVQAPAGSGKTELLTQRFLKLLAGVRKPEQVLAITFTRKATQEMRERILHRLRQANGGETPEATHEKTAIRFAKKALSRDRDEAWGLLANPGRLQIHTIDGLCARIAARSPRAGGVAGLAVTEDAAPMYRKAAIRLVEDLGSPAQMPRFHEALARTLDHLHGNTELLLKLLSGMLARRDQWLRRVGVEYAELERAMEWQQELELETLQAALGEDSIGNLLDCLMLLIPHAEDREKADGLRSALERGKTAGAGADERVRAVLSGLRAVATSGGLPFAGRSVSRKVLRGEGEAREGPVEAIRGILDPWRSNPRTCAVFQRFVSRPPLDDHGNGNGLLVDIQLLLRAAAAELEVLFIEEGKADFQYFAGLALQALGDEFEPGEALLIEDGRLEHILMDEFQDTSQTQYLLVEKLVSGWQRGDGRTLFLVGDPMQSIYRFRQADVALFNQVFESGRIGDVELVPLVLASNFRSRAELVHWVNRECGRIFGGERAEGAGHMPFAGAEPVRGRGGEVTVNCWPEAEGDEAEARRIARIIAQRLEDSPGTDIAVLARKRAQLVPVAAALQAAGIDSEAVNMEQLCDRPVTLDLLAITRAILHPADRVAWLALLRAPWCGLDAAQMHSLVGDDPDIDIFARLEDPDALRALPRERAKRVTDLFNALAPVMARRGKAPLHRLVEVAWITCKGPYAAGSQVELDNAQSFFDLLALVEAEAPLDVLAALEARIGNHYSGSREARVKLMTIHKAKGLEFHTVILPGLHKGVGKGEHPLLRMKEIRVDGAQAVLMAPLNQAGREGDNLFNYLGQVDNDEEELEARRALYVALTRAREELILSGAWRMTSQGGSRVPGCGKGTFMRMLWPCFEAVLDADAVIAPGETASPSERLPQLRLHGEPDIDPCAEAVDDDAGPAELRLTDREATALGEAVHFWLELVHNHWSIGWTADWFGEHRDALGASLRRAGASEEGLDELTSRLERMLCRTLSTGEGRAVVSPEGKPGSWAEMGFYSRDGMRLRKHVIDRCFIEADGARVIVDYKTGPGDDAQEQKWAKQLERYASLLDGVTGTGPLRKAVYRIGVSDEKPS